MIVLHTILVSAEGSAKAEEIEGDQNSKGCQSSGGEGLGPVHKPPYRGAVSWEAGRLHLTEEVWFGAVC